MMKGQLYINGTWVNATGEPFASLDPATGEPVWNGCAATSRDVDSAVRAARAATEAWSALPVDARIHCVEQFGGELASARQDLSAIICRATGKPRWEADQEVSSMLAKVGLSVRAYRERRIALDFDANGVRARLRFKPHGVVTVLGPFNMPGHLPNGHIIPALIAGNTVIFKPSEKTPGVGEAMVQLLSRIKLPPGVVNLVQGLRQTGADLVQHPHVDGVFFTGGTDAGLAIQRVLMDQPQKILALEMGGNNPLVVHHVADLDAAVLATLQSAYLTAGQRCTCARRLIVVECEAGDRFLERLIATMAKIRVGRYTDEPQPFMGPVISAQAARKLLDAQDQLIAHGAKPLMKLQRIGDSPALLRPGLIDVTRATERPDVELFGPILQLIRVADFDDSIKEANNTRYGLVAGLLSDDAAHYQAFVHQVRAGVINWNRPTNGASSALPFGGVGLSGNHRPAGYWAADYCSYPVASLETSHLSMPAQLPPGLTL